MAQTRLKSAPQTLSLPESVPASDCASVLVKPLCLKPRPLPLPSSAYVVTSSSRQFLRLIHIKRHHPERLSAESQVKVDNAPVSKTQQQQLQLTLQQLLQLLSTTTTTTTTEE